MAHTGPDLVPRADLRPHVKRVTASSILNDDKSLYSPASVLQHGNDSVWNSDGGLPQWLQLKFSEPVTVRQLSITFQGGFAGTEYTISSAASGRSKDLAPVATGRCEDSNEAQQLDLGDGLPATSLVRVTFNQAADFYGRIMVYEVSVLGSAGDTGAASAAAATAASKPAAGSP